MTERIPSYCTLCRSRCGCTVVTDQGRLTAVEPLAGHPTGGALCAKGRAAPELVASPRRLTRPLRRTTPRSAEDPGWVEISWDEALDEIAERLGRIRREHGAEAVAFAVTTPSGTPMVDSFEWVERFVRGFGSPNLIYAVEVCGWHKDHAHALTFGRGIGIPDYDRADTIVLWGHNPARTWLAQASRIAEARRRGARVVVVDPKPDGSGQLSDLWLRLRPGSDGALAMGAIRHLLETGAYDRDFVARWTNAPMLVDPRTGRLLRARDLWPDAAAPEAFVVADAAGAPHPYDTRLPLEGSGSVNLRDAVALRLRDGTTQRCHPVLALLALSAAPYTPERVAETTWLEPAEVAAFNALFMDAPRLAYHAWTGVGQHTNATATERAIATLYALTGACDRPGGNLWPVPPPTLAVNDYGLLAEAQRAKALGLDELPLGPPSRGWITARDFARAVREGRPYKVRALVGFGTNFVVSQGHSARNRDTLRALEFQVHIDVFMNPTAESADIVLPASLPWEHDALKIGFEITQEAAETIQFRPKLIEPPGSCRADYEIAAALALRFGMADLFFGGDMEAGWSHQLAPLGVTVAELRRHPEGRRFPQAFRYEKYAAPTTAPDGTRGEVAGFATPSRRVELYSERLLEHGYPALPAHVEPADSPLRDAAGCRPLVLTTAKSGWFVHSSHRHVASLRRKSPDPAVEIGPDLARSRGLRAGDWAVVETRTGSARLRVRLNSALDPRIVLAEFGWWEDCPPLGLSRSPVQGGQTSNINAALCDDDRDPVSGSVPLRAVTCDIRSEAAANIGRWTGKRGFVIAGRQDEAGDVAALDLRPQDGLALPAFRPGQHVLVSLPGETRSRAYSLTRWQVAPELLSIAVRRRPGAPGAASLSQALFAAEIGTALALEPPQGIFTPPLRGTRPVVLIAGGIGITPFLGYLEALAALDPAERVPGVTLLHACRNRREHPFAARIRRLARVIPTLAVTVAYSAPGPDDRAGVDFDRAERLGPETLAPLLGDRPLAYLCGSQGFVAEVTRMLTALGLPRFDVMAEAFVSPPEIPRDLAPQTLHLAGTRQSFVWTAAQGTILDAALAAGIALPQGCRVGQCESCVVRVAAGRVAHLNDYAGEGCLTCQAVPLTELTLAT